MLVAPADATLADTDPAVPGIREVLAPVGLLHRLGWDVADARVRYLRYKPGTSLVAGIVVTGHDGGTWFAQALAVDEGSRPKLAKVARAGARDDVGRGAVVDDDRLVAIADVTADRHLPGVRRLLRGPDELRPLVYKPGRRWVAQRTPADGPPELVKVHQPGTLGTVLAGHDALSGLPVPEILAVDERRGTVVTGWIGGVPLDTVPAPEAGELWAWTGSVLAQIHRRPVIDSLARGTHARETEESVAAVRAILPAAAAEARAVAERLTVHVRERDERVVHGDFSADQVIVRTPAVGARRDGSPVTVIDLDRVRVDDPMSDLASWYGAHVAAQEDAAPQAGEAEEVLAPLLAGYTAAGGVVHAGRFRLHCAAAVLRRATEPFRRHEPDWPDAVARLVRTARELVKA